MTLLFVVLLPWVLYQKVYDPPGNRLLKWHIAGVIDVDSRGFLEALYQSYKNTDVIENIKRIHSNLNLLYGNSFKSFNIFNIPLENRVCDFFYFSSFIFPLFCFVFLIIFKPFITLKIYFQKYKKFYVITFISLIFWCIIMFIPTSTINHHGSYVNNILLLVLILLYVRDFKLNLLYIILFYNIFYFSINYIV